MNSNACELSLIVVGINRWDDITWPFLESIIKHEPEVKILVIDNLSRIIYPNHHKNIEMVRTYERLGYNEAMNFGIRHKKADKYVCFNNDCLCEGPFIEMIKELDEDTLWGSAFKLDPLNGIKFVASAWLIISDKILQEVGYFDESLDAGFEELDYELRAELAGFNLDVAELPIKHLEEMTRLDEENYLKRWDICRQYFGKKHKLRTNANAPGRY